MRKNTAVYDLPEGFEIVSMPKTPGNANYDLPEGFEVVSTPTPSYDLPEGFEVVSTPSQPKPQVPEMVKLATTRTDPYGFLDTPKAPSAAMTGLMSFAEPMTAIPRALGWQDALGAAFTGRQVEGLKKDPKVDRESFKRNVGVDLDTASDKELIDALQKYGKRQLERGKEEHSTAAMMGGIPGSMLSYGLHGAAFGGPAGWGVMGGAEEMARQREAKEADVKKIAEQAALNLFMGKAFDKLGAIKPVAGKIAGAGAIGAGRGVGEKLIEKGSVGKEDIPDIAANAATMAGLQAFFQATPYATKQVGRVVDILTAKTKAGKALSQAEQSLIDFARFEMSKPEPDPAKIAKMVQDMRTGKLALPAKASGINFTMPKRPELAPMPPTVPTMTIGPEKQLIGKAIRLPEKAGEVPTGMAKQAAQARQAAMGSEALTEKGNKIVELATSKFEPYKAKKVEIFSARPLVVDVGKGKGLDLSEYTHQVDSYGLRHAIGKHGVPRPNRPKEIPLVVEDFRKIPEIINNPDKVISVGKNRSGLETIRYSKRYNGLTFYFEEIQTGRKALNMKTMYKMETPSTASHADRLGALRPPLKEVPTVSGVEESISQGNAPVNTPSSTISEQIGGKLQGGQKSGIALTLNRDALSDTTKNLPGLAFGIEPQYDDEGNLTGIGYSPAKGIAGFMGMGMARGLSGKMGIVPKGTTVKEREGGIATRKNKLGQILPVIRKSGYAGAKELQMAAEQGKLKDVGSGISGDLLTPTWAAITQGNTARGDLGKNLVWKHIGRPNKMANVKEIKFASDYENKVIGLAKRTGINHDSAKDGVIVDAVINAIPNSDLAKLTPVELAAKYGVKGAQPKHYAFVKQLRPMLDEIRDKANAVRKDLNKPEIGYLDSYGPHLSQTSIWAKLRQDPRTTISEVFDFVVPNEKFNPHAKQRILEELPGREKNLFKTLSSYIRSMASDIHQTPNIENIKAQNQVLREAGLNKAAAYWDTYIRTGIVGKPGWVDQKLGLLPGTKARAGLGFVQSAKVRGAMVGNYVWSVATQPLSYIQLTPKEAGWRNSIKGVVDWTMNPKLRRQIDKFPSMVQKAGRGTSVVYRGAEDSYDYSIYRSRIDKANDMMGAASRAMERFLHGASIAAGLRDGQAKGLKGRALLDYADLVGERTQSMYSRQTRAPMLNNLSVRAGMPFQSFSIEMFNHLREISGRGGYSASQRQRLGQAISLIVGFTLANQYRKALTGQDMSVAESVIPFLGGMTQSVIDKAIPGKKPFETRQPLAPLGDVSDLIEGIDAKGMAEIIHDYVKNGYTTNMWTPDTRKLRRVGLMYAMGAMGLGGSVQLNRTIDGLVASEIKGYQDTKTGKMAFPMENTAFERLRAAAMGPYQTALGREYLDKNLGPLGEKDSAMLKDILRNEGREAMIEEYREIIKDRLINRLEKEIKEVEEKELPERKEEIAIAKLERKIRKIEGIR